MGACWGEVCSYKTVRSHKKRGLLKGKESDPNPSVWFRGQQLSSVMGQRVNILGFSGLTLCTLPVQHERTVDDIHP